jgi:hypothetical protein
MLERAGPFYADGGLFLGYAGACVDIDAHKCMESGLARALERERRARIATEKSSRLAPRPHGVGAGRAARAGRGDRRLGRPPAGEDRRAARAHPVPHHRQPARARFAGDQAAHEPLLSGVRVLVAGVDGQGASWKACFPSPAPRCGSRPSVEAALETLARGRPTCWCPTWNGADAR